MRGEISRTTWRRLVVIREPRAGAQRSLANITVPGAKLALPHNAKNIYDMFRHCKNYHLKCEDDPST